MTRTHEEMQEEMAYFCEVWLHDTPGQLCSFVSSKQKQQSELSSHTCVTVLKPTSDICLTQ